MYKSKLQEYCQKQSWKLPVYSHTKHGPDHTARFTAAVTVNDMTFTSTDQCTSSKLAHNDAAKQALTHFTDAQLTSTSLSPSFPPASSASSVAGSSMADSSSVGNLLSKLDSVDDYPQINFVVDLPNNKRPLPTGNSENDSLIPILQKATPPQSPRTQATSSTVDDKRSTGNSENDSLIPILQKATPPQSPRTQASLIVDDKRSIENVILTPVLENNTLQSPRTQATFTTIVDDKRSTGNAENDSLTPNLKNGTPQTPQAQATSATTVDDKRFTVLHSVQHPFKNQLQIYVQKKNLNPPTYSYEMEGPPHNRRFRCKVTVNGRTFESPGVFHTRKEAEHAAAEVALQSLPRDEVQERDSSFWKNALRVLVEKEGFSLPVYRSSISGECHRPTFVSTVKVGEETYQGCEAKSKKQAEVAAAKVAYDTIINCKSSGPKAPPAKCQKREAHSSSSGAVALNETKTSAGNKEAHSSSFGTVNFEQKAVDIVARKPLKENRALHIKDAVTTQTDAELSTQYAEFASPESNVRAKETDVNFSSGSVLTHAPKPLPSVPVLHGNDPSLLSQPSQHATDLTDTKLQVELVGASKPLHKKVMIYPRTKNMTFPAGVDAANVLPISNDEWVAVHVNSSQ